jgi:hypothetical protein
MLINDFNNKNEVCMFGCSAKFIFSNKVLNVIIDIPSEYESK